MYSLFYLANPNYGGWITFTAHLSLKHNLPIYKITKRTEKRLRLFGYGTMYRNLNIADIVTHNALITACDAKHYHLLETFPDGSYIVIHDPSEVTKKTSYMLLEHLKRFNVITIRKSVQSYLLTNHNINSKYIPHPFYQYNHSTSNGDKAISISRVDYDKHTNIILDANGLLQPEQAINIHGYANHQYVYFKLDSERFRSCYKGVFPKTADAITNILKDAKFMVDMSVIKHDGGGTQYTFLEAIYHKCALVLNKNWIKDYETPFINGVNCYVVGDGNELASLIQSNADVSSIIENAYAILHTHTTINWLDELAV